MKKLKLKTKRNLKLVGITFLGAITIFASVCAIANFSDNKNVYADEGENFSNSTTEWLLSEKPENFEPQLTLHKYAGAENSFDGEAKELTIDFPAAYPQDNLNISAADWEEDKQGNYILTTNSEDTIENVSIEHAAEGVGTLLLEIKKPNDSQYSSFRMSADESLLNYVESNAIKTDIAQSSVEDSVIFTDAEIISYSADGAYSESLYNSAKDSWRDFSDEQIEKLLEFTNSREKRLKLEMLAEKLNNNQARFESKEGSPHITDYIPDFIFTYLGKSVFIGQEYGFLITVNDNKRLERINSETGQIEYYTYDNSGKEIVYHFNENNCALEIKLTMFSIDRQLVGREYKCGVKLLFNIGGSFSRGRGKTYYAFFNLRENICFMADPSISLSVKNLYDLNDYDTNYNRVENESVSISQVRVNFCGYDGEKIEKKKVEAKDIVSSIWSIGGDVKNIADSVTTIMEVKSVLETLAKVGGCVGNVATAILELNPYFAIAKAAYEASNGIFSLINSYTKVFREVSANNEANILTFPAPSEKLTTTAVASLGINYDCSVDNTNNFVNAANELLCFNGPYTPKFVMGKTNHYAQAIFMLSEINKPTAFISNINPAFAFDNSGSFDSKVEKFLIPEKFNYSEKISRAFDNGYEQGIKENEKTEVSFFGSDSRELQLSVSENGVYDFEVKNLLCVLKSKDKKENGVDKSDNGLIPVKYNGFDKAGYVQLLKNGEPCGQYIDKNGDNDIDAIRLNLDASKNNNFTLKICTESEDFQFEELKLDCLGATFTAELHKHYEEITPTGTAQKCNFNDDGYAYYELLNQKTGLYNVTVNNAEFDLYSYDFRLLNKDQKSTDVFMLEQENYYVCVKNGSDVPTITFSPASDYTTFDSGNDLDLNVSLSKSQNTKIYRLNIARTGIYTFDYAKDAGYTLQVKDESFGEKLFGAKKANLDAGNYYLLFKGSGESVEDEISISFTPQALALEKAVKLSSDVYYTFVPPQSGFYKFSLTGNSYAVSVDGLPANGENRYELAAGQNYIVHVIKNEDVAFNDELTVEYSPSVVVTYHKTINEHVVEFKTDITGYYSFNGKNMALYNRYLTLISDGNGGNFTCSLVAGEKYFIIKADLSDSVVVLEGKQITANFEAEVKAHEHYLKFTAPEDGYYKVQSYFLSISELEVFAYENLSEQKAVQVTENGYYLNEGCIYYIKINLTTTDYITVVNGNITALPKIPEGMFTEVNLNIETNYASSYKFIPSDTCEYTFIFSRNLKSEFNICVNERIYTFPRGANVLKVTRELEKGNTYEIKMNLTSEDSATLIFGVFRHIEDFTVYVSDRLQDNSGLVNKIAIGADLDGYVNEQISIGNINGHSAYTQVNYEILNTPIVDGKYGVNIDANGYITVSNRLPQWTAFAVEVNIGRVRYGDIILDNGLTKVINFLIYVDVQDIQIFDENENAVFSIDVAPKQTINLTAKVFPYHAAQANKLRYEIGEEGSQYVSLEMDGFNAKISGKFTTPNNTYVRIDVSCGNEFTAVIMVRVHVETICILTRDDINKIKSDESKTAYELILNNDISYANIVVPKYVTYLKIKKGSKNKLIDTVINVASDDLTLVLESVQISGCDSGAIYAYRFNLDIYFVGDVTLWGKSGSDLSDKAGSSAIYAKGLNIYKSSDGFVGIYGGDGYSVTDYVYDSDYDNNGGDGGDAISVLSYVNLYNINNLSIIGGDGGNGMDGLDATAVVNPNPGQAESATNGVAGTTAYMAGERGGYGGNGGRGISCRGLVVSNCENIYIYGGCGGNAGDGGNGADGGNGGKGGKTGSGKNAGNGGIGGNGSDGGNGGGGGYGASATDGEVTIVNSQPKFKAGDGGNGGRGGDGGNGGRGGDGGEDTKCIGHEGAGGVGGNGGNAGMGGAAGLKGINVNVSQLEVNLTASDGSAGETGFKGYGGEGGNRGDMGGTDAKVEAKAESGKDGEGNERT